MFVTISGFTCKLVQKVNSEQDSQTFRGWFFQGFDLMSDDVGIGFYLSIIYNGLTR